MANWIKRYLNLALEVAQWSKDPSTKVGAVIIAPGNKPKSFGCNGFPRGFDDSPRFFEDKDFKYRHVIHAETNAILNANSSVDGCTIYITHPPCPHCAGTLVQAGIKEVHSFKPTKEFLARWPLDDTKRIFNQCGIHFNLHKPI